MFIDLLPLQLVESITFIRMVAASSSDERKNEARNADAVMRYCMMMLYRIHPE